MRVLLVSSGLVPVPPIKGGAVELYVFKLCEALRRLGVDAYVIDRVWSDVNEYTWILHVGIPRIMDLNILKVLGSGKSSMIKELAFGFAVTKHIKKFNPDIVHANTAWVGYTLSRRIKSDINVKFAYTCHNPLWPEENVHFGEKVIRVFEGSAMRRADAVIAINETMRRAIVGKAGVESSKVFVIPNGVDIDFFKPGLECEEIKKKYGLEGKYVVLFVGRVTYTKGVHILLEALKIVREKYGLSDIKAVIVGPLSGVYGDDTQSEYVNELRRYAVNNNLDVVFTGSVPIEELRYIYSCSHVFVLPSYFEAFPMVLLEAMASGLPVIGSKAGGIVDVIKEGINGFLFTKGSPSDLAEKLYFVLSDDSLRQKMSINCRLIAETKYSWSSVATKMLKIYKDLT